MIEVPAAYSSQECSACGHVAAENRPSQASFECVACVLVEHADVNAAKVILARGLKILAVEISATGCGGSGNGRPKKQQLRVVRRGVRHGSGLSKAPAFRPE